MTAPASAPAEATLRRETATIAGLNFLSRLTGFVRVVAMAAALGATPLGDTYQAANLVSNILFELLAGGLLAAVLVPVFVERRRSGGASAATETARALMGRATLVLCGVVIALMVTSGPIMSLLTAGADISTRSLQRSLGTYLLWFFLPQIVLYAVGAIATALLQAERRFVAAALAPIFNNVVVVATMIGFRAVNDGATGLPLDTAGRTVLAVGTTVGVAAMTVAPMVAVWRAGHRLRPSLEPVGVPLRPLLVKGAWSAGHLGLNQVLAAATIVFAAQVAGGVVAYQVAFTFFLLPHAVLANPVATALYPRLAELAGRDRAVFADELARGIRTTALLVLPAAALLAALAGPTLSTLRLGSLDERGAMLVAGVVAAYAVGTFGYSMFHLLTRAAYALDDTRSPTVVNAWSTGATIAAMAVVSSVAEGDARVTNLGIVTSAGLLAGAALLSWRVVAALGVRLACLMSVVRAAGLAVLAGTAAWFVSERFDVVTRTDAIAALSTSAVLGVAVYAIGLVVAAPGELRELWNAAGRAS